MPPAAEQLFIVEELVLDEQRCVFTERTDQHARIARRGHRTRVLRHRPVIPKADFAFEYLACGGKARRIFQALTETDLVATQENAAGARAPGGIVIQITEQARRAPAGEHAGTRRPG